MMRVLSMGLTSSSAQSTRQTEKDYGNDKLNL